MTVFWFIRHGESEGNVGLPSFSDSQTPLTEKGRRQSFHISEYIENPPDLFVISPYLRAAQTAEPTLSKYPNVPVETWPIQEFSYLSSQQYYNTDSKKRRKLSQNFFMANDPNLVLGEGGESFNQFIKRIQISLSNLSESGKELVILFGHGWFMRATLWLLYSQKENRKAKREFRRNIREILTTSTFALNLFSWLDRRKTNSMYPFLIFSAAVQIPNAGILKFKTDGGNVKLLGFELSYLPEELREISLYNR